MEHHFPVWASNIDKSILVDKTAKMSTWMRRLEELSESHSIEFDRNDFVGNAFEHLVECIITWCRGDKAINCIDVKPSPIDEPGVDFIGIAHDMVSTHTIQCKYRTDICSTISETQDHIAMFPSTSLTKYGAKYMTLWTTASDLNRVLDEAWEGQVKTIGYDKMRKLIDDNTAFWNFYSNDLLSRNSI